MSPASYGHLHQTPVAAESRGDIDPRQDYNEISAQAKTRCDILYLPHIEFKNQYTSTYHTWVHVIQFDHSVKNKNCACMFTIYN